MFLARVLEASFFQDFGESIAVSGRRSGNTPGGPWHVCAAGRAARSIYIYIYIYIRRLADVIFLTVLRGSFRAHNFRRRPRIAVPWGIT